MKLEHLSVSLDDIVITSELSQRASRPPDLQAENHALRSLVQQLASQSTAMLKNFVNVAKDLCQAGTAGVSLPEVTPSGEEIFRWVALAGAYEPYQGGSTPLHFSPCAVSLEKGTPQLFYYPEQYFTYFQLAQPTLVEGLVVPIIAFDQPLGTIWIVSHEEQRQFDLEDVRVLTNLAEFIAAALCSSRAREAAEALSRREQAARIQAEAREAERQRTEEQIKASLREKEALLKEIHHRVKNNLQIISSLLRLQSEYIDSKQAKECFKASQLRVKSMALIHQKLYQSKDLSSIDAAEYIRSLAMEVFRSYNTNKDVRLEIDGLQLTWSPDTAIPCSLILCELISNCLKHAFPHPENACINIQLSEDGNLFCLLVSDNGIGIPEDLDFQNIESLGFSLVMDLVEQLEGTIELQRFGGTTFKISFPASAPQRK